ncbi:MAG: hypothetical protein HY393_01935 [Candidatus Diapherotrites archaeon]|nr:hypothetical protein [Candidatus Diapherotrites archaeon]
MPAFSPRPNKAPSLVSMNRKRVRTLRAMRPVRPDIAKEYHANGLRFRRFYSSYAGKLYGVSTRASPDGPGTKETRVFEVFPKTRARVLRGSARVEFTRTSAFIYNLQKPSHQQQPRRYKGLDVFRPILEETLRECRNRGIRAIKLEVVNPTLIPYYKRFGFETRFKFWRYARMRLLLP